MSKVVVIGGGFAGCAAAAAAAKMGSRVTLLERTDALGGFGLVAGALGLNFSPVREELKLMGSDDIFQVLDNCVLRVYPKNPILRFGGRATLVYDVCKLASELIKHLQGLAVEIRLRSRASDVQMTDGEIKAVVLDNGWKVRGDAFVDATGGAGPTENCQTYGNGCAMCIMRCPTFGGRVSIAEKAGVKELKGKKKDGSVGPISAAYSLVKESLAPEIREELEQKGSICIPLPRELVNYKRTQSITASVNIADYFAENIILREGGAFATRIAAGYTPLDELRMVPGFERAWYANPFAGSIGNGVRYMAITPRGDALNVPGVDNLFVASEKVGVNGIMSVIVTGVVAGHNATRKAMGIAPLILPKATMLGNFIAVVNEGWDTEERLKARCSIQEILDLHKREKAELSAKEKAVIRSRIEENGLLGVLSKIPDVAR